MEEYSFLNMQNNTNNDDLLDENSFLSGNFGLDSLSDLFIENITNRERPPIFAIKKNKSPGRKRKGEFLKKKRHSSIDKDNILCKIHTHFLNFLVNCANDAIKTAITNKERKQLVFKYIDHRIKKQISKVCLKNLIKKQIKDILQLSISKKYTKFSKDKDYNKNTYNNVIALSDWLKKLFNMNYLDAFKLYYNDCQPFAGFAFGGKVIKFSDKTKPFLCLYNEADTKEKKLRLKFIAEEYYLQLGNKAIFKNELSIGL